MRCGSARVRSLLERTGDFTDRDLDAAVRPGLGRHHSGRVRIGARVGQLRGLDSYPDHDAFRRGRRGSHGAASDSACYTVGAGRARRRDGRADPAGHLRLWHVWSIAVLLGLATAYDLPAYQSFFPQLVEREDLPQAIALNQATFHGSRIIGPAIASWFVARWGMAAAFFANGASFLAVIGSLLLIRPRAATRGGTVNTRLFMAEGVRYVRGRPHIVALLGLTAITTMFVFPNAATLMPFYAKHVLQVGPGGLGVMMAVSGAGAFLGAIFLLALPRRFRIRWITTALFVIALRGFRAGLVSSVGLVCSGGRRSSRSACPARWGWPRPWFRRVSRTRSGAA